MDQQAMDRQRALFRHGFALLTLGFVIGGAVGGMGGGPRARLFLGSHVTALLVGLLVIAVGVVWPRLVLGARGASVAYATTVWGNWIGAVVLGLFAPAIGFPSKISTPELPQPAAWANAIVGLGLVSVTVTTFVMCGLVLHGLRPATPRVEERSALAQG